MSEFNLVKIMALLNRANDQGVNISFTGGALSVQVQKGKQVDPELLAELRNNKPFLIQYFERSAGPATATSQYTIPRFDRHTVQKIPLSFAQERLWFIHQLEGSLQYHLPAIFKLEGKVDTTALAYTLKSIVGRHESLRTVIREEDGIYFQQVQEASDWRLDIVDRTATDKDAGQLQDDILALTSAPFDLSADYMLRATLIRLAEQEAVLAVTMHHIASDGTSLSIILKEVIEFYRSAIEDRPPALMPLPIQYADYAVWQHNYLQGKVLANKIQYWKDKLSDTAPLQLPTDFTRPLVQSTKGSQLDFEIDKTLTAQIQQLCLHQGTTLFMVLLAAFKALLYRYSGQQDICVGTPIAGRQQEELQSLIGFFINTLALRTEVDGNKSFLELLAAVKNTTMDAYEHQEVPFEKVVEVVVKERDLGRTPLFQVMFVLQNTPAKPLLELPELTLSAITLENKTAKFDLSIYITETATGLQCSLEYCTDLFLPETMNRFIRHYQNVLAAIVTNPKRQIDELELLSSEEKTQVLENFNDTRKDLPLTPGLIGLIEERAAKNPASIAVIFEDNQLNYEDLNIRANQLAHYLSAVGIGSGMLVPLCIERSTEMIICLLAILKTGAAFVPVDPAYPAGRINYMIKDSGASIVIADENSASGIDPTTGIRCIIIDAALSVCSDQPGDNLNSIIASTDLVYTIYTSGSTGKPKGVMISNQSVINLLTSIADTVQFTAASSFFSVTTFSFDIAFLELFMPLVTGGRLIISSRETSMDGFLLAAAIATYKPTHLQATPATWQLLLDGGWQNKESVTMLIGGEAIKEDIKNELARLGDLYNCYGPTETTIWSAIKKLSLREKVTIGKPIANTSMLILNGTMQLCPIGVTGEICIGGSGLARGYFNRPDLTDEKFIDDPYHTDEKIYRTGDVGRWLVNGDIECFGRLDDQVKVRGFRIELGEIETVLEQSNMVVQAVVAAKEIGQAGKQLVAYIVPQINFDREQITSFLQDKLPVYMVPSIWVEMDSFPLTPNGKINRRALPEPGEATLPVKEYVAPRNDMETRLQEAWSQALGVHRIGMHDNFFELGGHSLLAMRMISAIRKSMSVNVSIKDLFLHPTIESLATLISGQNRSDLLPAITSINPRPNLVPLSFSQERLWFIDQLDGSTQYHIPSVLRLTGPLNIAALEAALQQIINRHEILRTVIVTEGGQGFQKILPQDNWRLTVTGSESFPDGSQALQQYIQQEIQRPFNLSQDSLLRANLLVRGTADYILVATLHHIVSDGWSAGILIHELKAFYNAAIENNAAVLPALPVQYADFATWQRTYMTGEAWEKKLAYWKSKLDGVATLQLTTDFARPLVQSNRGAVITTVLDPQLTNELKIFSQQQGASLFMTLLSAFNVLMYRYTGQSDICVGTPIAGRQQQELEGLIGFFVNTLALRTELDGNASFLSLLQQVKTTTLDAYDHQEVPVEKIVELVIKDRDISRSPLFQVVFSLQNLPDVPTLRLGDLQLSRESLAAPEYQSSKFDLSFVLTETSNGLQLSVEYCTDLFRENTVSRMIRHFNNLLVQLLQSPHQPVGALPMLELEEEQVLLKTFNNSKVDFPAGKTVIDLFAEQVAHSPTAIALVMGTEQMTYAQLDKKSNQLADFLLVNGLQKEMLVPVCMHRGIPMVTTLLAILKAGGVYVPIDPGYPAERIRYMLEDTAARIAFTTAEIKERLPHLPHINFIDPDDTVNQVVETRQPFPVASVTAGQLAYVIYTSGSSGQPKGVMIGHGSLANLVYWHREAYQVTISTRATAMAGVGFDAFGWELWPYLSFGASIFLADDETKLDHSKLLAFLDSRKITHSFIATALLPGMLKDLKNTNLQYLLTGGDKLPAVETAGLSYQLVNNYGPTENTVVTSYYTLSGAEQEAAPIGKPVSNTVIYLLNEQLQLVPAGTAGEICIGGAGLARGYLNRPDLTQAQFISNPFDKTPGSRLYRSGDLGRWLPDGNIEYLGRIDEQVKIRGYRIELGEIETQVMHSGLVNQAVVLARAGQDGTRRLVGYVIAEGQFNREALISYLKSKLPEYMVPVLWVEMDQFPLTHNGKLNRKALPEPVADESISTVFAAPRNQLEEKLSAIWQQLLKVERIGINDNFFELGGHSLLAMQVVSLVRKELEADISIRDLFLHPTIAALADSIKQERKTLFQLVEKQERPEHIPLSFSQERLWFIDQLEGTVPYNATILLGLKGTLNQDALNLALQQVVNRHEVLRTVFYEHEGRPFQQIKEAEGWKMKVVESPGIKSNQPELEKLVQQLAATPFNLSVDYMLRATLVLNGENDSLLLLTMHHIASDAWSLPILVKEVTELYAAFVENRSPVLPLLPLQFADYTIWQRDYLTGETLEKKTAYWKQQLDGVAPIQLPTDYSRPAIRSIAGASLNLQVGKELSDKLVQLAQQQGVSLYMLLLATYKVMLNRYSGDPDICVGASIANRPQQELEGLIGFFVNTLALRTRVVETEPFIQLLQAVKKTMLEAYENQDMPFEKVVEEVVKERDASRTPLFQVMLVLINTPQAEKLRVRQLELSTEPVENKISKFDITFHMTQSENGLTATIIYNTDLFREDTIARMAGHFKQLLHSVVEDPQQSIESLQMLTAAEEQQFLMDFN